MTVSQGETSPSTTTPEDRAGGGAGAVAGDRKSVV